MVFPCGSETGLEINRSISYSKHFEMYGVSSKCSNHGKYVYKNYLEIDSFVSDGNFIHEINKIVKENEIDFIFPAHDSVVLKLSENLDSIDCDVLVSLTNTCQITRSKKKTYDFFVDKLNVPKLYKNIDDIDKFPVFLKPDVGQGSKGTYIAYSKEEVAFYKSLDHTLLILEYLPGKEYTIDCFTDRKSKLLFSGARERRRISNGISVDTLPYHDSRLTYMANVINESMKLQGVWFFQVKQGESNELFLMEIGPRVAGSMGLYRNLGINLPLLTLYDRMGIDVSIMSNSIDVYMDRALVSRFKLDYYYDNVYIDLDDTLIQNCKVNTIVIMFLYQCLNKGKKVYLLTRNKGDINHILEKYRDTAIFNKIIQIKDEHEKFDYIKKESSIFIDDSFIERYKVNKYLNIPTFDVNALECLIDYRL